MELLATRISNSSMINFAVGEKYFRSEYFEQMFLLFPSAIDPNVYSWEQFSEDFYSIEPSLGTVRLYQNGRISRQNYQPAAQQSEGVVYRFDKTIIQAILDDGGSIVINRFDKASRRIGKICNEISKFCGYGAVGNAYATKGGTGTFGKHWDSHCVFAAQLLGAKHWKVYRPTLELPITGQSSKGNVAPSETELVFDGILSAGDILYIPRGWWHEVIPLDNQPSLHVATGIHSPKIFEYLKWVLLKKMQSDVVFRNTMPLGGTDNDSVSQACQLLASSSTDSNVYREYIDTLQSALTEKSYIEFDDIFK